MSFEQPNLALAKRFLAAHGPPDEVLHVGITGAHIYGFPSADSDIDMKGIHVASTRKLLSFDPASPPYDRLEVFEGTECDLTTHEVAQALAQLLKGNGNVLERILSPYQLVDSAEFQALIQLAKAGVHQGFYNHYAGYFRGMQREHDLKLRAKTALYSYRVALTGVHLLKTAEVVTDVRVLCDLHPGFETIRELVAFKSSHAEKATIPDALDTALRADWPRLESALQDALSATRLPSECTQRDALEGWLLQLRRDRWT